MTQKDMSSADSDFVTRYTDLMMTVWRSGEERAKLLANPAGYAAAAGLPVAEGSEVQLDSTQPEGLYNPSTLIADWNATPGRHVLHVPDAPLVDLAELDERELDAVVGGAQAVNIIVSCVVVIP